MESKKLPAQSRVERKKDETQKKIMEVAMGLFNRQGFDTTTMEQIADEADIARRTLYNYFPVKEAIICEYVQKIIKEQGPEALSQVLQLPNTRTRLIAALRKSLEWFLVELNKEIYEIYFTYRMQKVAQNLRELDPSLSSGFRGVLEPILEIGKETGEIRQDVPVQVLASNLEICHINTAIIWVTNPGWFSIYDGIDINVDLFLNGAKSRKGNNG